MKHLAKTHSSFISESYVTPEGNLEGFGLDSNDKYEIEILAQSEQIREFLEEEGAELVKVKVFDSIVRIGFTYQSTRFSIRLNLESEKAAIFTSDRDGTPNKIYSDSIDSLFDLMAAKGLDFLR
jgi:hypothetical protein